MRRFGLPAKSGQSYTDRPGAYGIFVKDGQILLTHQSLPIPETQLPGGGIDPGETPLSALYREVSEETGYSVANARRIGVYQRYTFMPEYDLWARKICHIYIGQAGLRKGPPIEADHAPVWCSIDEALSVLVSAGDRHFLERFRDQLAR